MPWEVSRLVLKPISGPSGSEVPTIVRLVLIPAWQVLAPVLSCVLQLPCRLIMLECEAKESGITDVTFIC
jgi:hypothetical protein